MWRYLVGGLAALALVAAGVLLFNRSSRSVAALPAAPLAMAQTVEDGALPDSVPQASDRTREQKRFDRYDKDRNGAVTREEFLANRRKAYAKLDTNHDGTLSFDEWAIKAETKFAVADADKSGAMNATEFATTAVKRKPPRVRRDCPPAGAAKAEPTGEGEES
ncbi:EF-hand domain-containing protein [Sphingomonas sp. MMS24-J45]|uniref:EF-hand domain-containing protein n=1 Tax=Sphingomonas sp. MMS24-J45 TaxID=3238806 RepID=UPI0038514E20